MPSASSDSPSSAAEQIMPSEVRPYVSRLAMRKPPGSTAPGVANATRSPATKLVAPHTTSWVRPPTSTWQKRIGFLNSVRSSTSRTWPVTTPETSSP